MSKRAHIAIPAQLAEAIDTLVGKRARSTFVTEAAWKEVRRLRMLNVIGEASGAWKDEDHPELRGGAARYVKKIRKEDEKHSLGRAGVRLTRTRPRPRSRPR